MKDLVGMRVMNRRSYRRGRIVRVESTKVHVEYDAGVVTYRYPSAFADELLLEDEDLQQEILSAGRTASFQEFKTNYSNCLNREIEFLRRTGGKRYRAMDGRMIGGGNGRRYLYTFDTDSELHFPDGSEIRILTATLSGGRDAESSSETRQIFDYATVTSCEDFSFTISCQESFGQNVESIEFTAEPWQLMQGTVDRLQNIDPEKSPIAYMVACQGQLQIDRTSGIMLGQNQAMRCSTSQPVTFIWGPPGTGKTTTLAKIAKEFMDKKKRVLMLSYSNVSVDGAVLKVAKVADAGSGQVIRYGYPRNEELVGNEELTSYLYVIRLHSSEYQEYKDLMEQRKRLSRSDPRRQELDNKIAKLKSKFHDEEVDLVKHALFVATTVSKATVDRAVFEQKFDAVLFDEASMAYVPQIVFAASLAKESFCCLGDFKQLPAIVADNQNETLKVDIFQYCGIIKAVEEDCGHKWLVMLNRQYRMHPDIASFVSQRMYRGLIESGEGTWEHCQTIADCPPFAEKPMGLVDLSGTYSVCIKTMDQSRINLMSALVSLRLAELYCIRGGYQVGIITPYSAQARLLLQMVRDLSERDQRYSKITCATVHQFQGSEQAIIIYDAVDCFRMQYPGVLLTSQKDNTADRLFNVAMTRAQGKFIMVANVDYFEQKNISSKLLFTQMLNEIARNRDVLKGENLINSFNKRFSDKENVFCGGMEDVESWDKFLSDIKSANESIFIDIPDEIDSDDETAVQEFVSAVTERKQAGVNIYLRKDEDIDCFPQLRDVIHDGRYVTTPYTVIDKKVIWFGEPLFYGDFISMGQPIPTQTFPCIRFDGLHTARMMRALFEMTKPEKAQENRDHENAED